MIFSLKNAYSEDHGELKSKTENDLNNRKNYGIRELENIKLLAKYFLPKSNINLSENKLLRNKALSLLDIGCGDRYLSYGCKANGIDYLGVDLDTCNIEIEKVNSKDNSFDIITSLAIIEHLHDPSNLINESYRLLKKGGILVISTPNWKYCIKDFYDDPTHIKPYTEKSLQQLLSLSPFKSTKVIPNLRCKPKSAYIGNSAFFRAAKIRIFQNSPHLNWIPSFLKGKARGIFGIGIKD